MSELLEKIQKCRRTIGGMYLLEPSDMEQLRQHFEKLKEARVSDEEHIRILEYRANKEAVRADRAESMLSLANQALERAGSAARFGIKLQISEGTLVFKDTAESLGDNR